MTELAILIGLPGAGKSTFYAHVLAATHQHVSLDALGRASGKRARQRRLITDTLAAGRSVAVDNVNPTRAERGELVALGLAAGARVVGYWLDAPPRDCLARNAGRVGRARVPPVAIFAFRKRFEPPDAGEGFAALWRVTMGGSAEAPSYGLERIPA